ncbi:protein saal1 isoform X2 [Scyliorhinus canicula]|uniref:protein saal1 isoform X2 n=1 Tax=Scyliorhinus canicula TaxID=7830 RepID=UPI0018F690C4|nr:protein saal1 isoform X2 [Scyliorhinus canicula]XP_038663501.1 protein saal1 isoform X2 [Scyliorhinus canicula]XP_038663502.1 protein saal1 isoform X2 [Scyliorhinus canicula]XP_038663503.1 protein saal1 isoform X2 [Scyliorhinus canicula]XP_038663504.1 protein saal1 isoform X2 [Scyliorhinus canicula]XP_038663505.1 protein saal1 isoform X2 [Scyliorhinus canicula]XP_038663506.1 protein saal1 isoform X2 [Scyliorhinus canicula]XP_038663507.1 protein saal1 isoform X2 [Scyliorhinus canicula]XP_
MDRNPSPPPSDEETTRVDAIGSTVYSKHWLFSTLMRLIELVSPEGEDTEVTDSGAETELDEDLENEICKIWDMSMDEDVAVFLQEFNATDILLGIIGKSKCPRLTEICVGILGNMACYKETCQSITNNNNLVEVLLLLLGDTDPPTLLETSRLILSCLSQPDVSNIWIDQIHKQRSVRENVCFIMQSSTNADLLGKIGEMVDKLFDLDKELMLKWVSDLKELPDASTTEQEKMAETAVVPCLLEAARQLRSDNIEGLEVYMHILQLLTTANEGIQAIVKTPDKGEATWTLLNDIVCTDLCQDDDPAIIVEEQACVLSSTLAVLSAMFASNMEENYIKIEQNLPLLGTLLRVLLYAEESQKKPSEVIRRPSVVKFSGPSPRSGAQKGKRREGDFHLKILLGICSEFLSEIFMDISKEIVSNSFKEGLLSQAMCTCAFQHLLPLYHTAVERFHAIVTEVQPDMAEQLLLGFPNLRS